MISEDTIIAPATASGTGAIAVLRISGTEAIGLVAAQFHAVSGRPLGDQKSHTVHLGHLMDDDRELDQVLVTLFRQPHSYTGENVVEISCHGSTFIQEQIVQLFLRKGCRAAKAGEFTLRAFLNGKMDLSQAEAVADLIASGNAAAHRTAMQQMRGGFSDTIAQLRAELLDFASLIELELDFSEEDVEFADRERFDALLQEIERTLRHLIDSFAVGNVIKNGVPVAIVGEPNVGKSTLLNRLLNEERAIVSAIPGTTRDTVEDHIVIGGVEFRFIDTAGIRETTDAIEKIGIERSFEKIGQARVVLYLFDGHTFDPTLLATLRERYPGKIILAIANKVDRLTPAQLGKLRDSDPEVLPISALEGEGVENLKQILLDRTRTDSWEDDGTIITNSRHYDALSKAWEAIHVVRTGLRDELTGDLLAIDLRQALHHLGEITGEVTTDEVLGNIFSKFCIGK